MKIEFWKRRGNGFTVVVGGGIAMKSTSRSLASSWWFSYFFSEI